MIFSLLLLKEITKRLLAEKKAKEEIERLRRELESLKRKPGAPLPVRETKPEAKPKSSGKYVEPLAKQPLLDAFAKIQSSINKSIYFIGHILISLSRIIQHLKFKLAMVKAFRDKS